MVYQCLEGNFFSIQRIMIFIIIISYLDLPDDLKNE